MTSGSAHGRRIFRRALLLLAGLGVGLTLVELAFRQRDLGAFPHLNVYRPDSVLGVRLRPGATERISFGGNPISDVRINAEGYRGADFGAPAARDVIVLGDSQAFGLGVDEADTFAARLAAKTGRTVLNAGVPTYGPLEYGAVLKELLPRKPQAVVYVVNLANDLFEAAHPNRDRHVVYDGWAVRRENAPRGVVHWPGRSLLFRDSHAFFALRGAWLRWSATDEDESLPSEGTFQDLLATAKAEEAQQEPAEDWLRAIGRPADAIDGTPRRDKRSRERDRIDFALERAMSDLVPESRELQRPLRMAAARPGDDIVINPFAEASRVVPLTATQIARAAELRRAFERELRARHDDATLRELARFDELDQALRPPEDVQRLARERSALRPFLLEASQLCRNRDIDFVVVLLPLDVQVSNNEWAKYGVPPVDLSSTRILSDDLALIVRDAHGKLVDAWPVLEQAEPGAFLDHDLHMSKKGHAAIANALAKVLP